jgi:hypothetical protein
MQNYARMFYKCYVIFLIAYIIHTLYAIKLLAQIKIAAVNDVIFSWNCVNAYHVKSAILFLKIYRPLLNKSNQ